MRTTLLVVKNDSFNGKPKASGRSGYTVAFGLPLNDEFSSFLAA